MMWFYRVFHTVIFCGRKLVNYQLFFFFLTKSTLHINWPTIVCNTELLYNIIVVQLWSIISTLPLCQYYNIQFLQFGEQKHGVHIYSVLTNHSVRIAVLNLHSNVSSLCNSLYFNRFELWYRLYNNFVLPISRILWEVVVTVGM